MPAPFDSNRVPSPGAESVDLESAHSKSPHTEAHVEHRDAATTQERDRLAVSRQLHGLSIDQAAADRHDLRAEVAREKKHWSHALRSIDKWWTILLLLFGVTGVIGLPVLWMSRSFGPGMKWVLSIVVTIYTALLCWGVYLICAMAYENIRQAL